MTAFTPEEFLRNHDSLPLDQRLEALVAVLRGPQGCPWDQKQTAATMIDYVIDEAHELKEALAKGDSAEIVSELGDLAFTFTFLKETLVDVAPLQSATESVVEKMVVRHPHVFEPRPEGVGEDEIKRKWETLKLGEAPASRRLDRDLAASLPAWKKASKVLGRARNAGFRYPHPEAAWEKVGEEWFELQEALVAPDKERQHGELGDLMLALLTACKETGLDSERALLDAVKKLADRIEQVEALAGKPLADIPYDELGTWYSRARGRTNAPHGHAFFNFCGVSPWPGEVLRAVYRAARLVGRQGLVGALTLREEREGLREKLARLVGAEPAQVVLVPNVSSAGLGVAYCLDWRPGDTIFVGQHEFPANTVPWRLAADTFGISVIEIDDDALRRDPATGWTELERRIRDKRPRLLALSVVSYWSGYRLPVERLARLCHEVGTLLYLDAIQALGNSPVAFVEGIDFLSGGAHKALMAPEAAGFLIVSERARQHWVPRLSGWLGLPDPVDFLLSGDPTSNPNLKRPRVQDPSTLEGGSQNALGYAGLSGSLDYLAQDGGVERIYDHVQALHDQLEPGMTALGFRSLRSLEPAGRSAILSFDPPQGVDLPSLQGLLAQAGVEVSIPRGRLRFGFHRPNTAADVALALELMPELARRAGSLR